MTRPRLLDLYCGQGGAAVGYDRAGFDVVGVDIRRQPRYPFAFVQADATTFPLDGFDAIHASPPCQRFTVGRNTANRNDPDLFTRHRQPRDHPDLLTPTLARLGELAGPPWVVENVPGAPMPGAVEVCGAAMGCIAEDVDGVPLVLRRHRLFLSNVALLVPPCACAYYRRHGVRVGGVYAGGPENRAITNRALGTFRGGYVPPAAVAAALIGVDHMSRRGLAQAIPPAYTELIGSQMMAALT